MTALFTGGGVPPATFLFVGVIVLAVVLYAFFVNRARRKNQNKPGMSMRYETAAHTAVECRDVLGDRRPEDSFNLRLDPLQEGGWKLHLLRHNPTEQLLDTVYRLQFEDGSPTRFTLTFVSEAFGMREPVVPEDMLDAFFAEKLGARRLAAALQPEDDS